MKNNLLIIISVLILTTTINIFLIEKLYKPKKIVVVDIQSIISEYITEFSKVKHTETEIIDASDKFSKTLKILLDDVSKDNNLIILPKQLVYVGEDDDITMLFKDVLLKSGEKGE